MGSIRILLLEIVFKKSGVFHNLSTTIINDPPAFSEIIQLFPACHTLSMMYRVEFTHCVMDGAEGIILHLVIGNNRPHHSHQLDDIQVDCSIVEILRAFQQTASLH